LNGLHKIELIKSSEIKWKKRFKIILNQVHQEKKLPNNYMRQNKPHWVKRKNKQKVHGEKLNEHSMTQIEHF